MHGPKNKIPLPFLAFYVSLLRPNKHSSALFLAIINLWTWRRYQVTTEVRCSGWCYPKFRLDECWIFTYYSD